MTHVAYAEHLVSVPQVHHLEAMTLAPPPHIQSAVEHVAVLEPWAQSCMVGVLRVRVARASDWVERRGFLFKAFLDLQRDG